LAPIPDNFTVDLPTPDESHLISDQSGEKDSHLLQELDLEEQAFVSAPYTKVTR